MEKYAPTANASNGLYVYGFALADTFVQAMYKAGKNPTRAGLHERAPEPEHDEPLRSSMGSL